MMSHQELTMSKGKRAVPRRPAQVFDDGRVTP
jgi:hypothetical protein